jgi:hypothetical protein
MSLQRGAHALGVQVNWNGFSCVPKDESLPA